MIEFVEKYSPYPAYQDIFAFYTEQKDKDYIPLVRADIYRNNSGDSDRICFFYDADKFYLRYNRLFTEGEIEFFAGLDETLKQELIWFWNIDLAYLVVNRQISHRYYNIMYRIFFEQYTPIPLDEKEEFESLFENHWNYVLQELRERGYSLKKDSLLYQELYYLSYWRELSNNGPSWDFYAEEESFKKIKDYPKWRKERIKRALRGRESFEDNIREFGPCWFQGLDYTPKNSYGEDMDFVGQVWTDDIGYNCSKLVYLFYCPKDRMTVQVYDYD